MIYLDYSFFFLNFGALQKCLTYVSAYTLVLNTENNWYVVNY